MKAILVKISQILSNIPSTVYLWTAIAIGAASSSVTRKIIEIGENHLIDGRNPISLCNVLFVGNICAFAVMLPIFSQQLTPRRLKQLTRGDWISLVVIAILSGAIAPGLIFAALDNTNVTNVVLIGRLEPPIGLALGIWLLRARSVPLASRVSPWTVAGALVCFVGVAATALFASSGQKIAMMGGLFHLGKGELQVAIAALLLAIASILSKLRLQHISLGFFSLFRTGLGTIVFFILANYLYGSGHFAEAFSPFLWGWMLVYGAIIVAAGQLCWFAGLRQATVAQTILASSFNPIAAIAMAYLILGEVPTMAQYLGGAIILIGIVLSAIGNLRQIQTAAKATRFTRNKHMEMAIGFWGF
jgi:drug/metabolite transporter (DMT)-like permease